VYHSALGWRVIKKKVGVRGVPRQRAGAAQSRRAAPLPVSDWGLSKLVFMFRAEGSGFRLWVLGSGFRVFGFWFRVWGLGFRV